MTHTPRGISLFASLVLVSAFAAAPNAKSQTHPTTSAYVYVQIGGPSGAIYGFDASSTGKLTPMAGAPWKVTGQIVGDNKSQLITLGTDNIHSYAVESNGAIGSQLEQNPYTDYSGGECGTGSTANNSAVLDHTGKYVYIVLQTGNGSSGCAAVQSFNINSAGAFDGVGDTEMSDALNVSNLSILGAETFAYASDHVDNYIGPVGFKRESSGALEPGGGGAVGPPLNGGSYILQFPDASPTGNYVVFQMFPDNGTNDPTQLGSYTVNSDGSMSTTNTSSNMPASGLSPSGSTFSPSGNMFVLYADTNNGETAGNGIEIYNFNGAAPLTLYDKLLTGTPIDQVAWDKDNHMYAISKSNNMLYVYTVTPTSGVAQETAWSIGAPYKMIVVSE